MIKRLKAKIEIPLIVGGGIKTPGEARKKVLAGADILVTGNILEGGAQMHKVLDQFVEAVQYTKKPG